GRGEVLLSDRLHVLAVAARLEDQGAQIDDAELPGRGRILLGIDDAVLDLTVLRGVELQEVLGLLLLTRAEEAGHGDRLLEVLEDGDGLWRQRMDLVGGEVEAGAVLVDE